MKKGMITVGIILVLAVLAWFGGRKLFGTKEADTEAAKTELSDVSASDAAAKEEAVSADEDAAGTEESDALSEEEEVKRAETVDGETAEEGGAEEAAAETERNDAAEEAAAPSDENTLYTIKTSDGNNLGMVPIVNGSAVVLMDSGGGTTHQGEYVRSEEQDTFQTKLEEQKALAASEGKIGEWTFYRESSLHDFVFPEGINAIEKFAFSRSGLTGIVVPEGVTSIGYGAFYHCDSLSEVTIPNSVTVIEENAFAHTPWLESWMAGREAGTSGTDDFLIVGDGILIAYRGGEENPELPPEVKTVAAGVFKK